jgi:hypothetical protein
VPSSKGLDRRGPIRAKNVARPDFTAAKKPPARAFAATASPLAAVASGKTGTDDWESF